MHDGLLLQLMRPLLWLSLSYETLTNAVANLFHFVIKTTLNLKNLDIKITTGNQNKKRLIYHFHNAT